MQVDNRLIDDLARVAAGAVGALAGVRRELEARLKEQFEGVLASLELVTREEFDAVQAMAAKARAEQEAMAARLQELERRLAALEAAPPARRRATRRRPKDAAEAEPS
jgi:BMFP domain-containing protein YqiC